MTRIIGLATLALCAAVTHAQSQSITLKTGTDMDWSETPEGVAFAPLHGDRFSEPYQSLVRLPSGTVSPLHIKSANMFGIMIEGEMVHYADGVDPKTAPRIGPGSYYAIPAGLPHVSACVSASPCITYLYQDGAFDFLPVAR